MVQDKSIKPPSQGFHSIRGTCQASVDPQTAIACCWWFNLSCRRGHLASEIFSHKWHGSKFQHGATNTQKNESQQCKTMTLGVPGWMFRPISIDINRWIFHEINHPAIGVCGMPHLWWPGLPGDCSKAPIRSPKRSCETTAVVEGVEQGHPDVCGIWFDGDVLCTYKYIYIHYIFTYIYIYIKYTYLYIYNIYIYIYTYSMLGM